MTPLMKSDWAGMGWEFQWALWPLPLGVSPAQWTPWIVLRTRRVPLCLSSCFFSISGVLSLGFIDLADTYLGCVWTPQWDRWCCPFSTVIFVLWCLSALLHSVAKMQHLQEQGPCFAWFVCPVPSTKQDTLLTLKSFFFFPVTIPQGHWALDMLFIQGPRLTKW